MLVGRDPPGLQIRHAMLDALPQRVEVEILVVERVSRLAAALADLLGQLDHLVDRLLAGEPGDVVLDDRSQLGLALVRRRFQQPFDHLGIMTPCQPSRISERVPSKSNSAWRMRPRTMFGLMISIKFLSLTNQSLCQRNRAPERRVVAQRGGNDIDTGLGKGGGSRLCADVRHQRSPALVTPPPSTTRSGFSRLIAAPRPRPNMRAASSRTAGPARHLPRRPARRAAL